jgi:hypothetical protein
MGDQATFNLMTNRARFMLGDAAPLVAVVVVAGVAAWIGSGLFHLADGTRPEAPMAAAIADGLDELYLRAGPAMRALSIPLSGYGGAMAVLALGCLAWSISDTFSVLRSRVHGPGDALAVARSVAYRVASMIRPRTAPTAWGLVYDAGRREPVPFATVTLYAEHTPLATAISDVRGQYGFALSRSQLVSRGVTASLVVQKDGFSYAHDAANTPQMLTSGNRLLLAGSDTAGPLHIPLQRYIAEDEGPLRPSRLASLSLITAVLVAPAVLVVAPGVWSAVLVVGVVVAVLVRGSLSGL